MSAPTNLIAPTTAGSGFVQLDATEFDKVWINVTAPLAGVEVVDVFLPTTQNGRVVAIDNATLLPIQLTASVPSIVLEGGALYIIRLNATVGSTGVDYSPKPRQGT